MKNKKEIWKDIVGWEGLYQISNLARVKTLARFVNYSDGRRRTFPSLIKKQIKYPNGYLGVELKKTGRKRSTSLIHRLVAKGFIINTFGVKDIVSIFINK